MPKFGPNKPAETDFGLDGIAGMFDRQSNLQSARQESEQNFLQIQNSAVEQKAKIADSSAKITQNLLGSFSDLAAVADQNAKDSKLQRERFSSGDPMSALEAIGDQILDPSRYTQAGRQKKLNEAQQLTNVQVAIAGAQQDALQALSLKVDSDLAIAGAPLTQAKLNEQQGMERIETERLRLAAQSQKMATDIGMQQTALANMDSQQIKALSEKAQGQPIDVGGVLIQPGLLQERMDQMTDRDYQIQVREASLASSKVELAKKANRKILETYNLAELRSMLQTGDPTGQFELNDIQQVYGIKQQAMSDEIARSSKSLELGNFFNSTILPTDDQVQTMKQTVPAGTPLAASVDSLNFTNTAVAKLMKQYEDAGKPVPIEVLTMANTSIQNQKEEVNKALDKQATLMAKGDKDMKELYSERFRGNPLPQATVQSAIQSRLEDNKPLTDIMPKEVSEDVQRRYRDKVQKLTADSKIGGFGVVDKKAIAGQAMTEAVNEAVAASVTGRTTQLLTQQIDIPGNPLNGVVDKGAFLDMVAQADSEGKAILQQKLQLTDEEAIRAFNGELIPGKVNADIRRNLALIQNTQLFFKLDTQQAGLAQQYAAWWNQRGDQYIKSQIAQNNQGASARDLQSQALESFATPLQEQGSQDYRESISSSQNYYGQAKDEKYKQLITFNSNPTSRQAVLLQLDKELTNPERTTFMQNFVLPIVDMAKKDGADYETTNKMIEQAIDMGVASDPQTQKILNKIVRNRPDMNRLLDTSITDPMRLAPYVPNFTFGMVTPDIYQGAKLSKQTQGTEYDWFQNLMKTQGDTQKPSGQAPAATSVPSVGGGLLDRVMGAIRGSTEDFRANLQQTEQGLGKSTPGVSAQ